MNPPNNPYAPAAPAPAPEIDKERLFRGVLKFMEATARVEKLSDRELCALVIEKVWGKVLLGSEEDCVLDELISRFEQRCGIERDEEGRVLADVAGVPQKPTVASLLLKERVRLHAEIDRLQKALGAARSLGVEEIAAERWRQQSEEGFGARNDDNYAQGQLLDAAFCYVTARQMEKNGIGGAVPAMVRDLWPWPLEWWKPTEPVRDLAKAGALIAAEIDRLKREPATEVAS